MATIPLTLITGFLGSGKSSFINRLINAFPETIFGIVTNEYGDVGLESEIIGAPAEQLLELANGCMCCVRRDDLTGGVAGLLQKRREITQVLVEASGGSDPEPVVQTFLGHNPSTRTRFHSCICVVDAAGFLRDRAEHEVVVRQVRQADAVVVTKLDLVPADRREEIFTALSALVPRTPVYPLEPQTDLRTILDPDEPEPGELPRIAARGTGGAQLLTTGAPPTANAATPVPTTSSGAAGSTTSTGPFTPTAAASTSAGHSELASYLYRSRRALNREKLEAVCAELPAGVIRAKGLLRPHGPEHAHITYIVQYSAGRVQLYPCPRTRFEQDESLILFVGTELHPEALERELRSCEEDEG